MVGGSGNDTIVGGAGQATLYGGAGADLFSFVKGAGGSSIIADFNAAELMIRELIKLVYPKTPLFPPSWRMMICIPSSITEVEKRAVRDSAEQAGAKEVYLLHEPMAAALGIGIDVEEGIRIHEKRNLE